MLLLAPTFLRLRLDGHILVSGFRGRSFLDSGILGFGFEERLMNLSSAARRALAPHPAWSFFLECTTLDLFILRIRLLSRKRLDIHIRHDLRTLWASELVVGGSLQLRSNPGLETLLARVNVVSALVCRMAFVESGGGAAATAS